MEPGRAGAVVLGLRAALAAPLWLGRRRLGALLAEPESLSPRPADARLALRVARGALRRLARIPGSPWRNTCLYRSVAECLVLRACGHPARLRLGVRRGGSAGSAVQAHAWVDGHGAGGEEGEYHPLRAGAVWAAE